jgi:large repetitive protein
MHRKLHRRCEVSAPRSMAAALPARRASLLVCRYFLSCLVLLLGASAMRAQTDFGSRDLGSAVTIAVKVQAASAGTVSQVKVLTTGNAGLDYMAGTSDTCSGLTLAPGQSCTEDVVFTPARPGQRLGAVVLLDSAMRSLGSTYLKGVGLGGLAVFSPGNLMTVAGNGSWNQVNDGQGALQASLNLPSGVALDAAGNLYIADRDHHRIRRVDATTKIISTIAGNGRADYIGDGGPATQASLNNPSALTLDGAGNLYFSDTGNNVIRKVDAQVGIISTVAGNGMHAYSGDHGPATAASLSEPWGVTLDAAGNLFIADTANHVIRKVDGSGIITTVAGNGFRNADGAGAFSGDGGPALLASLNRPYSIALDLAGNAYIADSNNNRIRMINVAGDISTLAGTGIAGFTGDGGVATAAQLSGPSCVLIDAGQNLYMADTLNNAVRKVNAHTGTIMTIAASSQGKTYDNGSLVDVQLYGPIGLALDGNGNLYVADYYDMKVREVQANAATVSYLNTPTRVSDTSTAIKRWIEDNGTAPLTLTAISPVSNAAIDAATTSCDTSSQLNQNRSCSIGAQFAPAEQGNPVLGSLEITAQSIDSPLQITLIGDATPEGATTITVTSSQAPAAYGSKLTLTAAISAGANTPPLNGAVTFFDGATVLQKGAAVDAFGNATFTTSTLSIGTHTITASYTGDTTHNDSSSQPIIETVDEQTSISLLASGTSVRSGSSVTLTASVAAVNGGTVPPDGSVTFYDGQTLLAATGIDANVSATYTASKLVDGSHTITAVYSGDATKYVLPATSQPTTVSVLADSRVTLTSSSNPSAYGTAVTFTAAVSTSGTTFPTGEIDLLDGSVQIEAVNLSANATQATFAMSSLTAGTHNLTATYKGNQGLLASTSPLLAQSVKLARTTTSVVIGGAPIGGKPFTVTASVSIVGGTGAPTGTVTFADGATTLGSEQIAPNGAATLSITLSAGSHVIVATYAGDSNDSSSGSAPFAVSVVPATTVATLESSAVSALVFSPVQFTASVSGNGGVPTGTVNITVDGATARTAALNAGVATFTESFSSVGKHSVAVFYSGDENDASSSSSTLTQSVNPLPTVTTISSFTNSSGQVVLLATAAASSGPVPTGNVQFVSDSQSLGTSALNSTGAAELSPTFTNGTYTVTASYAGDSLHAASQSAPLTVSVNSAVSDFAFSVTPASLSVKTASSSTVSVTLQSQNKFADTISLGCLSLPRDVTCRFKQVDVNLPAGKSEVVQLTIITSGLLLDAAITRPHGSQTALAGIFAPGTLVLVLFLYRYRRSRTAALLGLAFLLVGAALGLSGCGAQLNPGSAEPGTYTIRVGGLSQAGHVSHYQNVDLTITK